MNWKGSSEEGEMQVRTPNFSLGEEEGGRRRRLTLERYMHMIYVCLQKFCYKNQVVCVTAT